jgi:tyrosine-protein kinase Etk/Wzc
MQNLPHVQSFPVSTRLAPEAAPDFRKYLGSIVDRKWLVAGIALAVTMLGSSYAFLATPVYESNLLVQVEDASGMQFGPFPSSMDGQDSRISAASREMEILRSRLVVSAAVDKSLLYIDVTPSYFPAIGKIVARFNNELSEPGLFGWGGYVWGDEDAHVTAFNVPGSLEGAPFKLTAGADGQFILEQEEEGIRANGRVGEPLRFKHGNGQVELMLVSMQAKPGAQFTLTRYSRGEVVRRLQEALTVNEKGKQSGIISVTLEGTNPVLVAEVLSTIGHGYLEQNEDRKSQIAERQLAFLNKQLPILKQELERSEASYNELRNKRGTIDLGEEAKNALSQSVDAQKKMAELRQKKEDLLVRFEEEHPAVVSINQQMQALNRDLASSETRIKKLPSVEQDVVRMARDVQVSKDVYAAVLTTAHQLRLITASKAPNVRLLDEPVVSYREVKPRRGFLVVISVLAGLVLGSIVAAFKKGLRGKVDYPQEVEESLGIPVSATIPFSPGQKSALADPSKLLLESEPYDQAVEGLRGLRTLIRDAMPQAPNNVVMITGPTPGVGKSFVSANLATLLASVGSKILLIDADMRTGHLHRYFGQERQSGLSDVLGGKTSYATAIRRGVANNVDFMPAGSSTPKSAELLEHPEFSHLLQMLSVRYDIILIDTPPVIGLADALTVAAQAGMVFNVVRARVTTMEEIDEAAKRLNQGGRKITGTVFNGLKPGVASHRYGVRSTRYGYSGEYK